MERKEYKWEEFSTITQASAKRLLQIGKHSLRKICEYMADRGSTLQKCADLCQQFENRWANLINQDHDWDLSDPTYDILLGLVTEVNQERAFFYEQHRAITDPMGGFQNLKVYRSVNNHKSLLPGRRSQDAEAVSNAYTQASKTHTDIIRMIERTKKKMKGIEYDLSQVHQKQVLYRSAKNVKSRKGALCGKLDEANKKLDRCIEREAAVRQPMMERLKILENQVIEKERNRLHQLQTQLVLYLKGLICHTHISAYTAYLSYLEETVSRFNCKELVENIEKKEPCGFKKVCALKDFSYQTQETSVSLQECNEIVGEADEDSDDVCADTATKPQKVKRDHIQRLHPVNDQTLLMSLEQQKSDLTLQNDTQTHLEQSITGDSESSDENVTGHVSPVSNGKPKEDDVSSSTDDSIQEAQVQTGLIIGKNTMLQGMESWPGIVGSNFLGDTLQVKSKKPWDKDLVLEDIEDYGENDSSIDNENSLQSDGLSPETCQREYTDITSEHKEEDLSQCDKLENHIGDGSLEMHNNHLNITYQPVQFLDEEYDPDSPYFLQELPHHNLPGDYSGIGEMDVTYVSQLPDVA